MIQDNPEETDLADGINTNLMEVMRLLMESETVLEWPASIDQVGGSLGLRTSERAVSNRYVELSSMARAERTIGSWAAEPCEIAQVSARETKAHVKVKNKQPHRRDRVVNLS